MKLSTILELLLIFLIISFAASKYVDHKDGKKWRSSSKKSQGKEFHEEKQATPNSDCSCSNSECHCCRDISLSVRPMISGPGCANITYLHRDSMRIIMSFGSKTLRNITVSGKKSKPMCLILPGGKSKFCGHIYSIYRDGPTLRACLRLELRGQNDSEASICSSCFKLDPKSVNVKSDKPVPSDEDEDDFGFFDDGDDDADDNNNGDDNDDIFDLGEANDHESGNLVESYDGGYTGFSKLSNEFLESFFDSNLKDKKKKPTVSAVKLQPETEAKPHATSIVPTKQVELQRNVTTKLNVTTPSKVATAFTSVSTSTSKPPQLPLKAWHTSNEVSLEEFSATLPSANKVYVSPLQYKPMEKVKSSPNQALESYIPTIAQLPTDGKVFTLPQQISTNKFILSTRNLISENRVTTLDENALTVVNNYIPTTQQFQPTKQIYLPINSSTSDLVEYQPITSTSVSVNEVQNVNNIGAFQNNTKKQKKPITVTLVEDSVTKVNPNDEYTEIASDMKTVNDIPSSEMNTIYSTESVKVDKSTPTTQTSSYSLGSATLTASLLLKESQLASTIGSSAGHTKQEDDNEDDFSKVADTISNIFGNDDNLATKHSRDRSISDESLLEVGLEDSNKNSHEDVLVNNSVSYTNYGSNNDGATASNVEDNENTKELSVTGSTSHPLISTKLPVVHIGREHKRMNLPPLFNLQNPEISSYWSSGGHVYKIRMSPLIQEPSTVLQNPNRLGRLDLFVPAFKSNPLNKLFFAKQQTVAIQPSNSFATTLATSESSDLSTTEPVLLHRFSLTDIISNRTKTNRSDRNHKRMRMPRVELGT